MEGRPSRWCGSSNLPNPWNLKAPRQSAPGGAGTFWGTIRGQRSSRSRDPFRSDVAAEARADYPSFDFRHPAPNTIRSSSPPRRLATSGPSTIPAQFSALRHNAHLPCQPGRESHARANCSPHEFLNTVVHQNGTPGTSSCTGGLGRHRLPGRGLQGCTLLFHVRPDVLLHEAGPASRARQINRRRRLCSQPDVGGSVEDIAGPTLPKAASPPRPPQPVAALQT